MDYPVPYTILFWVICDNGHLKQNLWHFWLTESSSLNTNPFLYFIYNNSDHGLNKHLKASIHLNSFQIKSFMF